MSEILIPSKGAKTIAFCETCDKIIYEAMDDNFITRAVMAQAMLGHAAGFMEHHNVYKLEVKTGSEGVQ